MSWVVESGGRVVEVRVHLEVREREREREEESGQAITRGW